MYIIIKFLLHLVSTQPFEWHLILAVPGTVPSLFYSPPLLILQFQSPNPIWPKLSVLFPFPGEICFLIPYSMPTLCGSIDCSLIITDLTANTCT